MKVTGAENGAAAGGSAVPLTCVESTSERDAAAYIWYKGGKAIASATEKVYTIHPVTLADSVGDYKCEATFATSTLTVSAAVPLKVYGRERSCQKLLFKLFSFLLTYANLSCTIFK